MAYFVAGPDGEEHGPVELSTIIEWVRAGTLPPNAPVRDLASGQTWRAGEVPELKAHYVGHDYSQPPSSATSSGASAGSAMIPTGNPDALWGYYLGFASLLCCIGLPATPFAIVKSVRGLNRHKENPAVHGKTHAIVGIVLACVGGVGNLALVIAFFVGLASSARPIR